MTEPQDIFCKDKARAFNPFLCARSDKLKTLIREVQTQLEGYEGGLQGSYRDHPSGQPGVGPASPPLVPLSARPEEDRQELRQRV